MLKKKPKKGDSVEAYFTRVNVCDCSSSCVVGCSCRCTCDPQVDNNYTGGSDDAINSQTSGISAGFDAATNYVTA